MRKRWCYFLQKAMAVLLSAVLCVGLLIGTEPVETWAADVTQTAWLVVKFVDYTGTSTSLIDVSLRDEDYNYYDLSASGRAGTGTYTANGLIRDKKYYWLINGNITASFQSDSTSYTIDRTCYPVNYMDGSKLLFTRYVESGEKAERPYYKPTKQDFTFVGWRASYGGSTEFPFSTRSIRESTNIYAAWRRTVTDAALDTWLEYALNRMVATNSTTEEYVTNYIKGQIDSIFEIKSTVTVKTFNPTYATSESEGSIELEVSVEYGGFSASRDTIKSIPMLPVAQGKDWILDNTGTLTITSQEGMNDWVQNGRAEEGNLSEVKNIVIQNGVTTIPDNAFNGCGNAGFVSIPNTVMGIGNSAFAGASSLGEVTLPPALQSIGDGAFSGCGSLEKVVMQGTTPPTSMGNSVFDGCKFVADSANTEGIVVPAGSGDAYKGAGGAFGEYVKEEKPEVTEDALGRKLQEALNNLPVSNDTTMNDAASEVKKAIDEYFQIDSIVQPGMLGITEATEEKEGQIVIEMTVSYGGYSARRQVTRPIPKLPTEQENGWTLDEAGNLVITSQAGMDDWVQNGRTEKELPAVKNVLIGDGVTAIPDNAFSGCSNLGAVSIPDTVTGIGDSAFADDSSLGVVTLPPNLQNIGDGAFSGCSSLGEVIMRGATPPASVGSAVFDGCKFVTDPANAKGIVIPPGSEDAYKDAGGIFGEYVNTEKPEITEEALNRKLQEILGMLTVSNDTTQETVRDTVKRGIDEYFQVDSAITIAGFTILEEATVESEGVLELAVMVRCKESFATIEGKVPIAKLPPLPDRGWTLGEDGNLIIDSQAGMDDWVQSGRAEGKYPAVKSILLQSGVTCIPDDAFSGCCDLRVVAIPDTVTSIGSLAFKHASSLSEITLPVNLRSIGDSAFSDCSSLERVVMQGTTPPSLGAAVFNGSKFMTDSSKGIVIPRGSEDAYKSAWGALAENILGKHTHDYAAEWSYDENGHWHECSCGGKGDMDAHTWDGGTVSKEPTEAEPGSISYTCSVCGMGKTESIPATGGDSGAGNGGGGNVDGNPSVSGNENPGGDGGGSVSGNDNQGGDDSGSVSGNDNQNGGGGNDSPPSGSGNNNQASSHSEEGDLRQPEDNDSDLALLWNNLTANTPKDREPRTSDGTPLELYATVAMIAGFFYLLLLFLDKYDITEEEKRESLARLVRWAKRGGRLRKLPVMAVLLVMRTYYHMIGDRKAKEGETGRTA